jgi:hypothetical protein
LTLGLAAADFLGAAFFGAALALAPDNGGFALAAFTLGMGLVRSGVRVPEGLPLTTRFIGLRQAAAEPPMCGG